MKQFKCPKCGGMKFTLVHRHYTVADFSGEGAIEGHPFLFSGGKIYDSMFCDNCAEPIEGDLEQEMLKEVV